VSDTAVIVICATVLAVVFRFLSSVEIVSGKRIAEPIFKRREDAK